MCVAIVVPRNVKPPSKEVLAQCEAANKDGGGIAWWTPQGIQFAKGLKLQEILKIMEMISAPMFIHFRISTVGGSVAELCHPFPVSKRASLMLSGRTSSVLMHNGHWSAWEDVLLRHLDKGSKMPDGPWSDTRAMAYMAAHYGPNVIRLIKEKVAVMHSDGEITTYGYGWKEIDGCYFSNENWKGWSANGVRTTYHSGTGSNTYDFHKDQKDRQTDSKKSQVGEKSPTTTPTGGIGSPAAIGGTTKVTDFRAKEYSYYFGEDAEYAADKKEYDAHWNNRQKMKPTTAQDRSYNPNLGVIDGTIKRDTQEFEITEEDIVSEEHQVVNTILEKRAQPSDMLPTNRSTEEALKPRGTETTAVERPTGFMANFDSHFARKID